METAARQHSEETAAKASARAESESASHEHAARQGSPNVLMRMQRTHGNRFVRRMVRAGAARAKVKISEPGDHYEQEADRVAERVMRMPARDAEEEEENIGGAEHAQLQRACAPCEEEQKIQRACAACDEEKVQRVAAGPGALIQRQAAEEDEIDSLDELGARVMAKRKPGAAGADAAGPSLTARTSLAKAAGGEGRADAAPRADSLDDASLQSGGQPMPDNVRNFYEERFGRDFGDVRVHTGSESIRANEDVNAYAFTYGNHVWLGRDQRVEPSFILAHELAHVVQQRQPPLMRKARKAKSSARGGGEGARDGEASRQQPTVVGELTLRRFIPYWEPYKKGGTKTHADVLPAMGTENGIFTEAPVPNADKIGEGFGKRGVADLYAASTTVGVFFISHQTPAPLPSDSKLMKGGAKFPHKVDAAPKMGKLGGLADVASGPPEIKLGDLKPANSSIEALLGPAQLANYIKGFERAQTEANELAATPGGGGGKWVFTSPPRTFIKDELKIPAEFSYPNTVQAQERLILKQASKVVYNPKVPVMGRLYVREDPTRAGIYNYLWYPDSRAINPPELPPKVRALGPEVEKRIVDPLITAPLPAPKQKSPKAKPNAPARREGPQHGQGQQAHAESHPAISHNPAPVLRRNGAAAAPQKDTFDFADWKKQHDEITKDFDAEAKTDEFKETEGALLAARAQEHAKNEIGLPVPEVSQTVKDEQKSLDKVEFWTGASSLPFGYLRRIFGTAFVKVAQLYIKIRDKFRELLKGKKRAGGKSGILGAALKAAFTVIKLVGSYVITQVVNRLMESLTQGVTEKVKALFSFEIVGDVQKKVEDIKKLKEEFERKAIDTVDSLLQKTVGPYADLLKQIEEIQRVVGDIVQIVNMVRWGVRVIACASPPAWGCLWILAQSVLEELASRVVETCWFKKKITPLINSVKWVADLPKDLADLIIDKIRGFLPDSIHDVFAKLDKTKVNVDAKDIECEKEDSEDALTPERQALMNMQETLGEEKFQAFTELVQKSGIPGDKPLSAEDIRKLTETIQKSGVTADQLKEYAAGYPKTPQGMPTDVATFLDNVKGGTSATPTTPKPAADPVNADPASSGGEDIAVAEAKDRPFEKKATYKIPEAVVYVVNQSWGHTVGTTPEIDLMGFYRGKAVVLVKHVKTKVTSRTWFPKGTDANTATYLVVNYQLQEGVDFAPIQGGLMKDEKVRAGLEVKKK